MTSETVQAAQRLLAEREAVGLKKYGTTVDRADLKPRQWLRHAIEEASDLLLYLMRLEQTMRICEGLCGPTMEITDTPDVLTMLPTPVTDFNLYTTKDVWTSQPAPAAAPEDAERAAYLERWEDAPTEATHLSEDADGTADWWLGEPVLGSGGCAGIWLDKRGARWLGGAPMSILGSVHCEPHPQPVEDTERAAYLARWRGAPADATHLAQDSDGKCWFYESEPILDSDQNWFGACALSDVADNLLGSVRCESRPVQGVGE